MVIGLNWVFWGRVQFTLETRNKKQTGRNATNWTMWRKMRRSFSFFSQHLNLTAPFTTFSPRFCLVFFRITDSIPDVCVINLCGFSDGVSLLCDGLTRGRRLFPFSAARGGNMARPRGGRLIKLQLPYIGPAAALRSEPRPQMNALTCISCGRASWTYICIRSHVWWTIGHVWDTGRIQGNVSDRRLKHRKPHRHRLPLDTVLSYKHNLVFSYINSSFTFTFLLLGWKYTNILVQIFFIVSLLEPFLLLLMF